MSKNRGKSKAKDKKNEGGNLQVLMEEQKRQTLEQKLTIRRLQDRLSIMTQENHEIVSTREKFREQFEETVDKQRIIIDHHQNTIKDLSKINDELQLRKSFLENKVNQLQNQCRNIDINRTKEFDDLNKYTQSQINKLQARLKDYNQYMEQRDQMIEDKSNLKNNLSEEKDNKAKQVADKERQKILATDKLKDEMLTKIRDMRVNLLSLKKDQLSTTTKLAVLQNHQLTSELQFQSKQSQKLVIENEQLHKKVNNLIKDLQIHKELEDQLAKRSHYSREIIKKLNIRISGLQEELEKKCLEIRPKSKTGEGKNEMIKKLDESLERNQKKYTKLQHNMDSINIQNTQLKTKVQYLQKKSQGLLGILLRFYEDLLNGNMDANDGDYSYDLRKLRSQKVQQWSIKQIKLVVSIMLNQLCEHINKKSLGIPNINKTQLQIIDDDESLMKLPRISEHHPTHQHKAVEQTHAINAKLVASNVREWGKSIHSQSVSHLARKYRIYDK